MNLDEAICGLTDDESDLSQEEVKAREKSQQRDGSGSSNNPLVIENAGEMNQELQ